MVYTSLFTAVLAVSGEVLLGYKAESGFEGREMYVETQLAKRLGRADAAAAAQAPLDAQQREEQELYGIPENLKARGLVPVQARQRVWQQCAHLVQSVYCVSSVDIVCAGV